MRHLLLLTTLAVFPVSSTHAKEWEPSETPIVAPAGCVEPIADGITAPIKRGPKLVGVYRLANGKTIDTPRLRLKAFGRFVPERMGSTKGHTFATVEAQLLPDVVRDGENPTNSKSEVTPDAVRILNYRVSTKTVSSSPLVYDVTVEDIGCTEESTVPPLAAGQSHTFWVSTDGVMKFSFSKVPWYMSGDRLQATLSASLGPDSQQKDRANPQGYLMLHLFEGRDGAPASTEFTNGRLAGAKATLLDYKVEVLRTVWGKDTRLVTDSYGSSSLVTKGKPPAGSVLVKVTRLQVTPRGY